MISASVLSRSFDGLPAVEDLSFEIPEGKLLAPLMGMASVLAAMRLSAKMTDPQSANQFTGLVIVPTSPFSRSYELRDRVRRTLLRVRNLFRGESYNST